MRTRAFFSAAAVCLERAKYNKKGMDLRSEWFGAAAPPETKETKNNPQEREKESKGACGHGQMCRCDTKT